MSDLTTTFTQKIISDLNEKKEAFIREKLKEKGFDHLISTDKHRFPKITRCIAFDGWEYIFVDNETLQGEFIVAVGPWEHFTSVDSSKLSTYTIYSTTSYTFKWQDTNFDAVRLNP